MASLQKFKLLATQCGVAPSPTRSPVVQLRRRKTTLRMLLSRTNGRRSPCRRQQPNRQTVAVADLAVKKSSLKDLFVSSPPKCGSEEERNEELSNIGLGSEPVSSKPGWIGFRHKLLLRRAWRPMLVTILE
ncbi:hypothetical protein CFOL_v3_09367 [Cephalotus follicularis]|uniref:Uncharacterized protein n=1 Tax=Cephalotus follicularis TaxID=3775 RepID=A0A1Q3BDI4_CEPFO|nr:hypothetical protein CFOL_v3_09367 [Cephalotus follicularis]